jgi:hemolysin III
VIASLTLYPWLVPEQTAGRRPYSLGEEIANCVTHGVGWVASIVGLIVLVSLAGRYGTTLHVISVAVYGATLVLLYGASTMYHALTAPRAKAVFQVIDHAGIYLLIAGSYTPFTLLALKGPGGWSLFGAVWTIAVVGVSAEAWVVNKPKWASALIYLAMGWLVIVAIKPLVAALSGTGLWLLVAGGLCYTLGTVFYVMKKVPYMHAVWHLFVLAGSAFQFLAILLFVLPRPGA